MANEQYPANNLQKELNTELVNQNTSAILENRLEKPEITAPQFFDADSFEILKAVSSQLIPQTDRIDKVDLASILDKQLAESKADDWRYGDTPPDNQKLMSGLKGVDETAEAMFGDNFTDLDDAEQDGVLNAIEKGEAQGKTWETISSKAFLEELSAAINKLYESQVPAQL